MIWAVITLSVLLNIFFFWYTRNVLRNYFYVLENLEDLFDVLDEFHDHLETIHSSETYYGDTSLQNLIRHSKTVATEINEYKKVLSVIEEEIKKGEDDGQET
jgi:hypothetical protein|tara:strand:- start:1890 stop:2195 length:306 start_codon:yes stop_codon:yes gene_type:complete